MPAQRTRRGATLAVTAANRYCVEATGRHNDPACDIRPKGSDEREVSRKEAEDKRVYGLHRKQPPEQLQAAHDRHAARPGRLGVAQLLPLVALLTQLLVSSPTAGRLSVMASERRGERVRGGVAGAVGDLLEGQLA
jgi:hypothetical protein